MDEHQLTAQQKEEDDMLLVRTVFQRARNFAPCISSHLLHDSSHSTHTNSTHHTHHIQKQVRVLDPVLRLRGPVVKVRE